MKAFRLLSSMLAWGRPLCSQPLVPRRGLPWSAFETASKYIELGAYPWGADQSQKLIGITASAKMFIVTRIWISISDLDLNSIIESHNENLKNLLNFIIIIELANGMGSFGFFGFISRPWHFWAHINYHCDPFDTRTPNFYFLGWFSNLFFWPKKRCAFWLRFHNFRLIQYFFLSNTEEFTPHRPSRSVAI